MFDTKDNTAGTIAGAIDLLVDFATLGEYGLESPPAAGRCEMDGRRPAGWEALATPRRGSCIPARRVDFRGAIAHFAA